MNLSENFTLAELTETTTGEDNLPDTLSVGYLQLLCVYVLQPTRDKWGRLKSNSGFRSPAVNDHRFVRGAKSSEHLLGKADDFKPLDADIEEVFDWMVKNLKFGQLILERKMREKGMFTEWIHVSLPRLMKPNMEAMIYRNGVYTPCEL